MVRTIPFYWDRSWSTCAQATPLDSQSYAINGNVEATVKTSTTNTDKADHVHPEDSPQRAPHSSLSLRANIHFATLCWTAILAGWNDASNGPLLPRIQQVYHVCSLVQAGGIALTIVRTGRLCHGVVDICLYDHGKLTTRSSAVGSFVHM